jgi:hypothetical protein
MKNISVFYTDFTSSSCTMPYTNQFCGGREKLGKSKMLIFQGNDSKFHIIPKIL